jgi:hypothetical protein
MSTRTSSAASGIYVSIYIYIYVGVYHDFHVRVGIATRYGMDGPGI